MRLWDWIDGLPKHSWGGGVYALYLRGRLLYVGRSRNCRTRLLYHRRQFEFDAVKIAPITNYSEQQLLERRLLYRLRPPQNKVIPTNLKYAWWYRGRSHASR